jgi:anti-sigma B factor antagonist
MQTDTRVAVDQISDAAGLPVTVLRFAGDISSTSREAVLGTYQGLSKIDHPRILLDFTKVDYLNSSGIALVIQVLLEASRSEQSISIFGLTPHFQKVFTMVGITKYTTLYPDEAGALSSFR